MPYTRMKHRPVTARWIEILYTFFVSVALLGCSGEPTTSSPSNLLSGEEGGETSSQNGSQTCEVLSCDDGNPCTSGAWNEVECACDYTLIRGISCDDENACTSGDSCTDEGQCLGTSISCDDDNGCTDDACNGELGCVFTPREDGASCSDGNACTLGDSCLEGECSGESILCEEDDNPCTTLAGCNSITGECTSIAVADGVACSDGSDCTLDDQCVEGGCTPGKPLECDDANPCTTNSCVPKGGCTYLPNEAFCDDDSLCTSNDVCAFGQCGGAPISCDDGNPCTTDGCNPDVGCTFTNLEILQ